MAQQTEQLEGLFARLDTAVKNGQAKRGLKAADESEQRAGERLRSQQRSVIGCTRQHDKPPLLAAPPARMPLPSCGGGWRRARPPRLPPLALLQF